jgi:AcrR family transcriptional regulator
MTTPEPTDRRVRRTMRTLRESLIALTLERGWDQVTVQDVCRHADVGRSTFYVHFADKESLLLSGFDELHAALATLQRKGSQPFAFAEHLLQHASENERLFRVVAGRQSGQQIQWRFRDVVTSMVEAELAALKVPKAQRADGVRFISGGFVELIWTWLERPQGRSPQALAEAFRALALATLAVRPAG